MAAVSIKKLAETIGITGEKLLQQIAAAGISDKEIDASLDTAERDILLNYLRGNKAGSSHEPQQSVTLKRRTTSAIKQSSRTGPSRTVHVEVKKRRTYVRRGELQRQQEEAQKAAEAEEIARKAAQAEVEADKKSGRRKHSRQRQKNRRRPRSRRSNRPPQQKLRHLGR